MTRRPPYQAHLRVYEPVQHLPAEARSRWTRYAEDPPTRAEVEAGLFHDTVRRLAGRPPVPVPPTESHDALLLEDDGELFVCPQQPRLAVWQKLGSPDLEHDELPGEAVPPVLREQAAADLAAHLVAGGEGRLFSRTVAWHVPVAWFVPFAADERRLVLGDGRSLTYRTAMSAARRRAAVALRTAREALGVLDLVEEIEDVGRWLEEFDPRSRVELDYAGLADLLGEAHLADDDSASDVCEGLAALAEGDATSAAAAYRRWTTRWRRVQLLARSS
ncbi:hypothetical protein GCM10027446_23610 [Angustibacter peucedani]